MMDGGVSGTKSRTTKSKQRAPGTGSVALSSAGDVLGTGSINRSKMKAVLSSYSRVAASHARVGPGGARPHAGITVLDDEGRDVTPAPLLVTSQRLKLPATAGTNSQSLAGGGVHSSVSDVIKSSSESVGGDMFMSDIIQMSFGDKHFRSSFSAASESRASGASSPSDDGSRSSVSSLESGDEREELESDREASHDSLQGFGRTKQVLRGKDHELDKPVHIMLAETNTVWLLDIPSTACSNDFFDECAEIKKENQRYKELKQTKLNNDNYIERGMQTFNNAVKQKDVQATSVKMVNTDCMVTEATIYDDYAVKDVEIAEAQGLNNMDLVHGVTAERGLASTTEFASSALIRSSVHESASIAQSAIAVERILSTTSQSIMRDESASEMSYSQAGNTGEGGAEGDKAEEKGQAPVATITIDKENLKNSLLIMERAIVGNNYYPKLIEYRDATEREDFAIFDDANKEDHDDEERDILDASDFGKGLRTIQYLWSYRCELSRGRQVHSMTWNKKQQDILAIAYGECKVSTTQTPGLILCWSVKNPEWPERIYKTSSAVTSLDFSKNNPNLLAVGFANGVIAIYDVCRKRDVPILQNEENPGKHHDPIWELKWIERERVAGDEQSKSEFLVSVSTDGRVCQWVIHKGMEYNDLMVLKRVTKQEGSKSSKSGNNNNSSSNNSAASQAAKSTSFVSRFIGGLCFDFNPKDNNTYLVGTEDGYVHRCSGSYNEQYLGSYPAHTSPVYRVKWSPFLPNVFLSCSADWSIKLWLADEEEPVFKFQSGKDSVTDIAWSPKNSTMFGTVSMDGRLEIWDLSYSVLDPAIVHVVLDRKLTSITFSTCSSSVLIGDDYGNINVFKVRKGSDPELSPEEQTEVLRAVIEERNNANTGKASEESINTATGAA